jgi:predicted DNA-binding transcriptional regulator YafY
MTRLPSSRTERLFLIVDHLRQRRTAATVAELASLTCVTERSIFRDLATLRAIGVPVDGSPGVGVMLRRSVLTPSLSFSDDEIQAISFGLAVADQRGLSAARSAAEKLNRGLSTEQAICLPVASERGMAA